MGHDALARFGVARQADRPDSSARFACVRDFLAALSARKMTAQDGGFIPAIVVALEPLRFCTLLASLPPGVAEIYVRESGIEGFRISETLVCISSSPLYQKILDAYS